MPRVNVGDIINSSPLILMSCVTCSWIW